MAGQRGGFAMFVRVFHEVVNPQATPVTFASAAQGMGWYKHWFGTRYYKLLYGHRDDADAAEWVDGILGRWRLPQGAAVLDLACGRGRHVRHFMERGMRTTGLDISEESIAEARILAPGADLRVGDMRTPVATAAFDGVCCLFTSLGYFETAKDDQDVFDAVATALRPGGRFVLDFMNSEQVLKGLVGEETIEHGGIRFHVRRDLVNDIFVKRIAVFDGAEEHHFEERVQALRPDELLAMATSAGLEIEDCTDGPAGAPFDAEQSGRFVLWTRRP